MELTRSERLILSLLYKILEKIDPDEGDYYKRGIDIVEYGYSSWYSELNGGISEDGPTAQVQEEVVQILMMHRGLENGLNALGANPGIDPADIQFTGFDGNNENHHHSFGKFLNSQDQFTESNVVNSHMPKIEMYRRQLAVWQGFGDDRFDLEKEQIEAILAAKTHPDYQ